MDPRLEERYIVVKIKGLDIDKFLALDMFLSDNDIRTVDCVVVEEDWPEYKPTVDAIMKRVRHET